MSKEEIYKKIQEAIDALLLARDHIRDDELMFEAEGLIEEARDVTSELYHEIYNLANEQEKKLGEEEEKKGYEVVEEKVLPEGTRFYVRLPNGEVMSDTYWLGWCLDVGAHQYGLKLYADHTVERLVVPNYIDTLGAKWFLTREEAEESK